MAHDWQDETSIQCQNAVRSFGKEIADGMDISFVDDDRVRLRFEPDDRDELAKSFKDAFDRCDV